MIPQQNRPIPLPHPLLSGLEEGPSRHVEQIMALQLALAASVAVLGGCRYHIGCAHTRPNDPNALFEWKGVFHMMWQGDGGWDHATSPDMARWTTVTQPPNHRKGQPAIAGPSGWDGSMTIIPSIDGGLPVALFDCIPGKDAVGIKSASCSNYSSRNAAAAASTGDVAARPPALNVAARPPALNFGDPSFIGIARPVDANDPNLAATWRKDARGHISILNETGGTALGFSGPSPIWKAANGEYRLVMTYGPGHTGLFCSTDPSLFNWTVCADGFYPDRDAGGAMFLALPPLPLGDRSPEQATQVIPYTHLLFGVTPGLGKGVAALGVRQLRHHFGPFLTHFSAPPHPIRAVCCVLLGARADWVLIGAWNPML